MEIITFDSLPSTNDFLMDLSKKDAKSWTVIHAINQTNGRGYAGNPWKVESNQNLTFSFYLQTKLGYHNLISLNEWVAYCIFLQLNKYIADVEIKWPNDIIINNKKVCGVLIENYKANDAMNSIIGIGINVNQLDFNNFPKASSLAKETAKEYDIVAVLTDLMHTFQENYYLLAEEQFDLIHNLYNKFLFRKDKVSTFKINDEVVEGIIKSCTKNGLLLVEINGTEKEFLHKQIELVF